MFLSVKCHRLCSLTSFAFFLIRQVAVSWLSAAVTHTLTKTSWGHLRAFRGKEIITVADSSYFVYAQYHRLSLAFHCINLSSSHTVLTHLGTAPTNVSACSSGFCEPVTYEVPLSFCRCGLKCLPYDRYYHVRKGWQDLLRIFSCALVVRAEHYKLQRLCMRLKGMKCKMADKVLLSGNKVTGLSSV